MKHCSVMFCAPRWICGLAAPAVRHAGQGRGENIVCHLYSPAQHSTTQCKWQSMFPGSWETKRNSTANDYSLPWVGRFLGGGRQAGCCCRKEHHPAGWPPAWAAFPERAHAVCGRKAVTFRRHRGDEMTALTALLPSANHGRNRPIHPTRGIPHHGRAGRAWVGSSSVKSQPPRCSEGPDERAVAWYCSPAVKLAAVSLHRVSSFMSSVGLVVNRHYARQVDDQTLDLLLSAGACSTPTAPAPAPAPSPWEL